MLADIFQLPHRVVGEVSHRARGERGQSGHHRGTMLAQQFLYDLDRAALAIFFLLAALHHDRRRLGPHLHVGTRSQKGVASDLLATLHRLEQESVGLIGGNREKGGDRRQQIGRNRFHHRHQRGLSGQPGKFLVVGTKHGRVILSSVIIDKAGSATQPSEPVKSDEARGRGLRRLVRQRATRWKASRRQRRSRGGRPRHTNLRHQIPFATAIAVLPALRPAFSSAIFPCLVPIPWRSIPAGPANSATSFTTAPAGCMCIS